MSTPHFHELTIKRVTPEAAGAVAITLDVPPALREAYQFTPGQFLTLRAAFNGESVRRSYSICSSVQRFAQTGEIDIGVKPVAGGVFSNWAVALHAGERLDVMTPQGRFTPQAANAVAATHRVAFAAGSGITPVLSIMASTLAAEPSSRFTLIYGNQNVNTIMFNEALQDIKDSYPARVTLIHVLSRQAQEVDLLCGRLDGAKVGALLDALLPVADIDEAFVCGPEEMIAATESALVAAGLPRPRLHAERFQSPGQSPAIRANAPDFVANNPIDTLANTEKGNISRLQVVLDGKTHTMTIGAHDKVLDTALAAGLDLPYACRGGVCCTCRARVVQGKVVMEKNFTLEAWEIDKGFVLTCQARPLTAEVIVSFDER